MGVDQSKKQRRGHLMSVWCRYRDGRDTATTAATAGVVEWQAAVRNWRGWRAAAVVRRLPGEGRKEKWRWTRTAGAPSGVHRIGR